MKPKITSKTLRCVDIYYWKCEVCGKYFVSKGVYYIAIDRHNHIKYCKGMIDQWLI
jgi:hypothetical protein